MIYQKGYTTFRCQCNGLQDYEIVKHKKYDISTKLQGNKLQEKLKMQNGGWLTLASPLWKSSILIWKKRWRSGQSWKIKEIMEWSRQGSWKEVPRQVRSVVVLNKFLFRVLDKCHPYFKKCTKEKCFGWNKNARRSFRSWKIYLVLPPLLIS